MKRIGVFFILFLTSCGGGGGGSGGDSTPAPTPAPVINLSASLSEQLVNSNITLTWSSSNTTSCTASGDWSGAKTTSGSEDVTISKAGTNTFSLACSGGGGTRSNAVTVIGFRNTDGIVVDGYISGADVFIDENDNFENDGSEYSTTSDNEGKFTIRYANGNLVSIGGTDLDSQTLLDNLLITHKLSGHTEFKAVTPITSIEAFMEVGANINDALGIDSSIDISITDPVANKGDDGIYDFLYEKGNQLTVLAYALQNITNDLNTTTETTEDYFKAIAEEIENEFNETSLKVDIETQTFINKTFENIIAAKAITIDETAKANTVIALSGVLPIVEVKASDDLTTSVIRFAISTLQEDIKAVANGTASAEKITSYTTNVIDYIAQDQNINSNDITPDITAFDDSVSINEDNNIEIYVLLNDSFLTSAPINIFSSNGNYGTSVVNENSIIYQPNLDYNGTDVFSYTITQGDKVSSADVTVTVTPVNDAPSIDVASTIQAAENQTAVTTISVSDVDEDELTLTMAGTDAESFILSNEYVLSFKEAPDYETKNSYSIELNLTDGNESVSKVISIIVNNSNDIAPVFISEPNFDAPENQIAIGTVNAIDADGDEVTFSVSGDELAITSAGVLSFVSAPDYETKIVYIASVTATDGVNSTTQDISVNVTNVNDISPVFTSELTFSAPENQISIGTVNAIDVEGDVISFSISGSELEITSAGFLTFVSAPDYETKTNYTAMVSASDGLNITTQEVYVNVTNLNDNSPEFLSNTIITAEENQSSAGIIKARDLDGDIINFSTMSNEFIITSSGELSFVELPNFETKSSYTVKIDITDGFNSNSKDFNIRIIDVEEDEPVYLSHTVEPSTLDVRTEDATLTYTIRVTDETGVDQSKLPKFETYFSPSYTDTVQEHELTLISGDKKDGIYSGTATIPAGSITGTWNLLQRRFTDENGIRQENGPLNTTFEVISEDQNAPTVTSFDFSPKEVDVREESKIVTLTAAVQDNIGITEAARYTIKNFTNNTFPEFRGDFELSSGTIQDGIWTAEVIIPTSTYSTDDYDVQMSPFKDAAGNGASIAPGTLGEFGDRTLTVIGLEIDEEPPTVTSFDFSPKEVDVREESKIVTLTAAVQDNIGITEAARYTIKNFTNNTFPEFRGDFELSSGTIQDGIWTAEVIIPTSTYSTDDYDVQMSPFKDAAGNGASIAPGTLGEFGDRTLTVLSNSKYNMNAPVFTSENSYSVEENILEIGTVTATDADGDELTFSTNSNSISIEPSSGLLKFINAPDFESQSSYTELITVSDGTYSTIMNLLISITDVDELSTANDCNYVINDASNNEFRYCWEESQSTSGTEYSANIVKPLTITFADESIEIPNISYAEKLYIDYGVILESTSLDWTNDQAYAIYQTLKKIPQNIRNEANDRRVFSKWTLTDLQIQDDISFDKSSKNIAVTIETSVFENANPRIASVDGKKGIYFSNKLHNALVRYITDGGKDASAVNKILLERYGVTTDIDDYSALTGEQATRFQAFQAEELVAIISMFEEMPSGYHKIDGLDYLVRRINGADNPYYPEAPAIAWDSSGYIEFMERAFNTVSIDYLHRLILHEKAHFLWAKIFDDELKNDWIELGGWYECSEKESGWCTTKQTEFVSAYAHLKNPNEDMAESLSYFIINPDALKSRSLAKYEFVRDRIMQGNIYISQIQENLTFTVYNLYPDYVFPGKVKKLLVSVDGEPIEDKTVTVEIQLHALDKILEGAAWARMRVFSTADTYFDLYLYPQNGQNLDTTLRGTYTLSKYAKSGFWKTSQLVLSDEVGNLRMEGANDFGWRMYVNNPNEDLDKPLYIADSMSLTKSLTTIENQEVDVITALWDIDEAFPRENQGCYGALNDENPLTYSLQKYSSQTYFGNYEAGKCLLEYVMPSYMPSGTYRLNYIRMIDEAGNESRNYFATPSGVDTGDNFSGDQLDELAKEVVLETSNPDITAPELDLNNLSISATPTNPDNPNGETIVKFTFRVKDDISGYKLGYYTFRDPQGLTSGFYHYPERRSEIFPSAEDLDWYEYTSTVVLPAGSAPGTWGVVELTLRDRALNFKTYSFTEIISFQTE